VLSVRLIELAGEKENGCKSGRLSEGAEVCCVAVVFRAVADAAPCGVCVLDCGGEDGKGITLARTIDRVAVAELETVEKVGDKGEFASIAEPMSAVAAVSSPLALGANWRKRADVFEGCR
jgi:hypothetical protein